MKSPKLVWQGVIPDHCKVRVCIDKSDVVCVEQAERDAMDNETWVHVQIDNNLWRKAVGAALRHRVAKEGA